MKSTGGILKNKQLGIIALVVVLVAAAAIGLSLWNWKKAAKTFAGDGYILVPSTEEVMTTETNEQYYFSAGTTYREKMGSSISFKDTSDNQVITDKNRFIHYTDGSLTSFTKGVVMDLNKISSEQVTYYGVSDKSTIVKNGTGYAMSYLGDALEMQEFIWKIAEDTYMVVAPQITVHLNDGMDTTLEDYVQIQYVEGGIARLTHQQGTYQTISSEAYLLTDNGIELNLLDRLFYVNGIETVSLNDMVIDSSDNLMIDEDEQIKIPTFNVVNGKDGEAGTNGEYGENGEDGSDGYEGDDGVTGNLGGSGADGEEGDSGDWGYDGKDGEAGKDAENSVNTDGIAAIEQQMAPKVSMETASYEITANSVAMNLVVADENDMLYSDLKVTIYDRATGSVAYEQLIARGATGAFISTNALKPDTEYVLVVNGDYAIEDAIYNTDFYTKIFRTDGVGITLSKVQILEDSITVETVKTEDSKVATYGIALYDENDNLISNDKSVYTDGGQFTFKEGSKLPDGTSLKSNTKYKVKLTNIFSSNSAAVASNVFLDVMTLKKTPYYWDGESDTSIALGATKAVAVGSKRYRTITVSLDTSLQDPDGGIKKYYYELYEVASVGAEPDAEPVMVKEVQGMQNVSFDVEADRTYVGRVVVAFDDNEKTVELPSAYSDIVTIGKSDYPVVGFEGVEVKYDSISGYIKITDTSHLLLDQISADYPLVITMVSEAGEARTLKVHTPTETGPDVAYFYFSEDGLRRNTKYAVTVTGPVNTTGMAWDDLNPEEKKNCENYYLAGMNADTGNPTTLSAYFEVGNYTSDSLFNVGFGITSISDAAYEVNNLEKLTFKLIKTSTGQQIGQNATIVDTNTKKHESDFINSYSSTGNPTRLMATLTDASFGASGDSRISGGGEFAIVLVSGTDYTENTEDEYTNEMDWEESTVMFTFTVSARHTPLNDINRAISVTPILNEEAKEEYQNDALDADTVVGLNIMPDYQWADAVSIKFFIYAIGVNPEEETIVYEDSKLDNLNFKYVSGALSGQLIEPIATKTVIISTNPQVGHGITGPWTVYFDETVGQYSNIGDDGTTVIFERGKQYFIRYEVTCSGELNGETAYPDCLYDGAGVQYYRSQVFELQRQKPQVQRYLGETVLQSDKHIHQIWKYRLVDPDNAIYAITGDRTTLKGYWLSNADFSVVDGYAEEMDETLAKKGTAISLESLYDAGSNKPLSTFEEVACNYLSATKYYCVTIPYKLCNTQRDNVVQWITSKPVLPDKISALNSTIFRGTGTDATHQIDDYQVNGVMLKGIQTEYGVVDDAGYRIRLTLQGNEIFRVAALRVTLTEVSPGGSGKKVVYDPVAVTPASGTVGNAMNNYAYAYLEYDPVIEAGLADTDVTVQVEAYYTTGNAGMDSFREYDTTQTASLDENIFTDSAGHAWALRRVDYSENNYDSSYFFIDSNGILNECPSVLKDVNNVNSGTGTRSGSIMLPAVDDADKNAGFTEPGDLPGILAIQYTSKALVFTNPKPDVTGTSSGTSIFNMNLGIDENGLYDINSQDNYYVMEEISSVPLQFDCGLEDGDTDYTTALFHTGDGMPGVRYNRDDSSIGMSSASLAFYTKGMVPNASDKGIYITLYSADNSEIPLEKYRDVDGNEYYLVSGKDPTTENDVKLTGSLGMQIVQPPVSEDGICDGSVSFQIRGLGASTNYYVNVWAKRLNGTLIKLFDYDKNGIGINYSFKTQKSITMSVTNEKWIYNTYTNKYGEIPFSVDGSEGMNMRIYYRIYEEDGTTMVQPDGMNYVSGKGYLIEPNGSSIKYYDGDPDNNNPVKILLTPGGAIELNKTYVIKLFAYSSSNSGVITNHSPIGEKSFTVKTPERLLEPQSSLRVVPGKDSLRVTVVMNSENKSIIGDKYTVELVNSNQVVIQTKDVTARTAVIDFTGLDEKTTYMVRVKALLDTNNDGAQDATHTKSVSTTTVTSATANIMTSNSESGSLIFTLRDCANFDNVNSVMYTIDADDGSANYLNHNTLLSAWISQDGKYSLDTGWVPTAGTYMYTVQYYDSSMNLLGTTTGYFTK